MELRVLLIYTCARDIQSTRLHILWVPVQNFILILILKFQNLIKIITKKYKINYSYLEKKV